MAISSPNRLWTVFETARGENLLEVPVSSWPILSPIEKERAERQEFCDLPDLWVYEFQEKWKGPPFAICRGQRASLESLRIGFVGTRAASGYGLEMTRFFCKIFANLGVTVISGGALGIDSAAYDAVIEERGSTCVVLPCGIDIVYPPRHKELFESVFDSGCLISRFPSGTLTRDHTLLLRNEVVAALSKALVVCEAPTGSGSIVTAQAAMKMGIPVFVIPGPAHQESFRGSHELIRSGATLCDDPSQVIDALGLIPNLKSSHKAKQGDEALVLAVLSGIARNLESIAESADLSVDRTLSALTMLEIDGAVSRFAGGYALKP